MSRKNRKENKDTEKNREVSGFEIVRLNIREMQKKTAKFSMTKNNLNSNKIKIRSSEIVRIVNAFEPENLKKGNSKYPYIEDLIILKIGKSYNAYYEALCTGTKESPKSEKDIGVFTLEIVNIDKNKNITVEKVIRYKRLLCGSSFVRNSKELYIREELYNKVMEVLLTGIPSDALFSVDKVAKFSTYLGLAATDSKPVSMPNICVVKDYTKKIKDAFDIIKQIKTGNNEYEYEVINFSDTLEETEEEINCFDGAGIVSYERAAIWAKELGLSYVPSSFQIRVLNGIKGNLYTFPVTEYIQYMEENGLGEHLKVTDLWNDIVDIKEQKIDVFLTESQFKFYSMYSSFQEWKDAFDTDVEFNGYPYKRTFNISDVSREIGKLNDELWSAYQPLQTLAFTDDELIELAEPTISMAKELYTNIYEFIKYRGIAIESDKEESSDENNRYTEHNLTPWYYRALSLDDSLQYDPYIRKKIEKDLESLQRRIFMCKIILKGNYQTAMPDLLALMEHIFGMPVIGALKKGEIYSNYWNIKKVDKVSIWRNPHIACEWINAKVVDNENTRKWFKYQDTGIITDIYGTLPLRLGTMDFDGDTVASVSSDIIYNAVERANIHTIRFIPYKDESKKTKEEFRINDLKKIMYTNKLGFQNNIGDVTNKVTVLWALYGEEKDEEKKKEIGNYIKIMSVINQLIIDFVKTGIKVPIPKDILKIVSKAKKPAFMKNKNGRWVNDNKVSSNAQNFDYVLEEIISENKDLTIDKIVDEQKKYKLTNGTADKLYKYLYNALSEIKIEFESSSEQCQFTKLLKDIPYIYNATYPKVEDELKKLLQMHNVICGKKYYDEKENSSIDDSTWRFERFYSYCEEELLSICPDRKLLLDYITHLFYTNGNFYKCDKGILWNVFGEDICNRYMNKEINVSQDELKKLDKKEKKAKSKAEQIEKMCSNANIICIKDLPEQEIYITDTELEYVKNAIPDDEEAQRLVIALLALYRKINIEKKGGKWKAIRITKGKKNEITAYQLCKLADIHYNQFYNRLKLLHQNKLIDINLDNMKIPKIVVCIPALEKKHDEYAILDINNVRENVLEHKFA